MREPETWGEQVVQTLTPFFISHSFTTLKLHHARRLTLIVYIRTRACEAERITEKEHKQKDKTMRKTVFRLIGHFEW